MLLEVILNEQLQGKELKVYESTHGGRYERAVHEEAVLPKDEDVKIRIDSSNELSLPQEHQRYLVETVWSVTRSGYLTPKTIVQEKDDMIGTGTITITISGRLDRVSSVTSPHIDEETYFLNFLVDLMALL